MKRYSIEEARESLDELDDYSRMTVGVEPVGPVKVLEDVLSQAEVWRGHSVTLNAMGFKAAKILGLIGGEEESFYGNPRELILKVFDLSGEG